MKRRYGFELLREQVAENVISECAAAEQDCPFGDTPIERLLFLAVLMRTRVGACEYTSLYMPRTDDLFKKILTAEFPYDDAARSLIVRSQVQLEDWRVDFVISVFDHNEKEKWDHLIVECDGHDFHERTKEQATRDRSRDRQIMLDNKMEIMRFTGSEIWRDPWSCAEQITDWAAKRWWL